MKSGRTSPTAPAAPATPKRPGPARIAWAVALLAAVSPLWSARDLPLVDLPQHLYVLEVLRRLHDARTLFPQTFEFRALWSPYLGYYAVVGALNLLLPLELANRLFLTAMVAALPLSMAFLLRSLRRPAWAALLTVPFAYGDSFAWGFVNTCAAMPFALFAAGAAVRAVSDASRRARWAVVLAVTTLAGFALHPAPTGFLAFALPLLLVTTAAPEDGAGSGPGAWLRARAPALVALVPLVLAAVAWAIPFAAAPHVYRVGTPHAAAGPMLSSGNLEYGNRTIYLQAFPSLLGDVLKDGSDQIGVLAVLLVALLAMVARFFESAPALDPPVQGRERVRPLALVGIAFALYMLLPLNIRGYIYYLNPRYAALAATLAAGLVPRLGPRGTRWLTAGAAAATIVTAIPLAAGFRAYDREAAPLRRIAAAAGQRPRVIALMFDPRSSVARLPVYVHAGVTIARERGGLPNYTLAGGEQIPLRYRGTPPPSMASEWRPDEFDYDRIGVAYDHFLIRGATPDSIFGARLGRGLRVAAHEGDWWLVRRDSTSSPAAASADSSHSAPATPRGAPARSLRP